MISFVIFLLGLIILVLIIDLLQRKVFTAFSWSRQATHVLSGLVGFLFPLYLSKTQIIMIAGSFTIIMAISKAFKYLRLHAVERFTLGEVFFPMSFVLLALVCLPGHLKAYQAAVLCLAVSDMAANTAGQFIPLRAWRFGKHQKSLGGVLSFMATALLVFFFVYGLCPCQLFPVAVIVLILALVEFFSFWGLDNLLVPMIAAGLSIWLL